jgi:hypothetical protein
MSAPSHTPSVAIVAHHRIMLAAVGILSHGGNRELRGWIRRSWLSPSAVRDAQVAGVVVRFVLRGISAPPEQRREAELNGDIAFVQARADLKRGRGPLLSLFLWWRLALSEWPAVQLIGKADGACPLWPGCGLCKLTRSGRPMHIRCSLPDAFLSHAFRSPRLDACIRR